jgi:hypothetical protein
VLQQALLSRPGNKDIMLELVVDYGSNPGQFPVWQAYLRKHQPPTLVVWGKNDAIFPEAGAHPMLDEIAADLGMARREVDQRTESQFQWPPGRAMRLDRASMRSRSVRRALNAALSRRTTTPTVKQSPGSSGVSRAPH